MNYVLFYGWQVGYRKITSVQFFQNFFQLTTLDAYDRAHSLLCGEVFSLPLDGSYNIDDVISQFREIGALCRPVNRPYIVDRSKRGWP